MDAVGKLGTACVVLPQNALGTFPTRNYSEAQFEHAQELSGEKMAETLLKKRDTCYACVVRCKRVVEAEEKVSNWIHITVVRNTKPWRLLAPCAG